MNCFYHAEVPNTAFCIQCGRALCTECVRNVRGSVYCEPCLGELIEGKAATTSSSSSGKSQNPKTEVVAGTNPGAAFALGLIPGVGAIYNGEFVKAAVHILIFGTLVSMGDATNAAVFSLGAAAFYFYMPFEAYYTAKKRMLGSQGVLLETPIDRLQQQFGSIKDRELWGGIALVIIGGLYLLGNLDVFDLRQIGRLWPVVLVVIGVWLLKNVRKSPYEKDCPIERAKSGEVRMLGPLLLIVIGILFLLNNMYPGMFRFGKMWPVILIVVGLVKVIDYFRAQPLPEEEKKEGVNERSS